jgi:hypothetical protein
MKAWMLCAALFCVPGIGFAEAPSLDGKAFDVTFRFTNDHLYGTAHWTIHGRHLDVRWNNGFTEGFELQLRRRGDALEFAAQRSSGTPPKGATRMLEGRFDGTVLSGTFRVISNKSVLADHYVFAGSVVDAESH